MYLSANWKFRIGSAPPYAVEVMRPAFGLRFPGTPISESGLARLTWLKRFTASTRNSIAWPLISENRLKSEASVLQYPGPRSELRGRLPNVPGAGREKALPELPIGVVLNQWSRVPPPAIGSPPRFGRLGPVSRSTPASR